MSLAHGLSETFPSKPIAPSCSTASTGISTANSCTPTTTTSSNTVTPVSSTDGKSAMTVNYNDEVTPPESFFESSKDSPKIVYFIRFCSYLVFILSSFMLTLWALVVLASLHYMDLPYFEDTFMEYG